MDLVSIWFQTDDPALSAYRSYLDEFGNREWMLLALTRRDADTDQANADRAVLVARLADLEHVHAVVSAADLPASSPLVRSFCALTQTGPDEALLLAITNDIETQSGYREALLTDMRDAATDLATVDRVHLAVGSR